MKSSVSPFLLSSFGAFAHKEKDKKQRQALQWAVVGGVKDVSVKILLKQEASLLISLAHFCFVSRHANGEQYLCCGLGF